MKDGGRKEKREKYRCIAKGKWKKRRGRRGFKQSKMDRYIENFKIERTGGEGGRKMSNGPLGDSLTGWLAG